MTHPLIQITDETGNVIETMSMPEAFKQERIRHTVYVMLTNSHGKYLLQQRTSTVPNYPAYWEASAGGHIDSGETAETAAYRELSEELGVEGVFLSKKTAFYFESKDQQGKLYRYYTHVYTGQLDKSAAEFKLAAEEVQTVRWCTKEDVRHLRQVTPISLHILRML